MNDSGTHPARFTVGIDLGTTNSAVAYVDSQARDYRVRVFPVVQFVAPGETEAREVLPSFHYTPAEGEFPPMRLPWQVEDAKHVVGVFARDHGASVPGRLVVSAKSWLSHAGVDRTANLLPWHGASDVEKLSPMEVSSRYLAHIRAAWNHQWPDYPLEQQDVTITIPASFDEIARELTVNAARRAGLPRIVLLEEPQAAFYAWIHAAGAGWDQVLKPGHRILVCDIGGGTTDFTLIQVRPDDKGDVRFHRFAVGDHLILGGDNLDLALAHHVEQKLTNRGKLEPRQWSILVRRCQQVKEGLLGSTPPATLSISVPSAGSRLIGGALSVELTREEVAELLVDGFLPRVGLEDKPTKRASGFQEFGLPYAPDHAITRYLAAFLTAHRNTLGADSEKKNGDPARPDAILFNGGLFESPQMRTRLLDVLSSWFGPGVNADWSPILLENARLDLAVAIGAAYYGMVRRGAGIRISGGLARSYYVGVREGEAISALCIVPAGLEEGHEVKVDRQFELLIRQPVEFPLFVSSSRTMDKPGEIVPYDPAQLSALPPIRTVLHAGKKTAGAEMVSVQVHARLTEIGTLEIWCREAGGPRTWKLQFDVRSTTQTDVSAHEGAGEKAGFVDEGVALQCRDLIQKTFAGSDGVTPPEALVKRIEEVAGIERLEWPPSLLRRIWEELMHVEEGRKKSIMHEARWLNLLGFSLRPGYGVAVDDWRVAQTWRLFEKKVQHPGNELCRAEWWVLWRRIAGGLVTGQQRVLADPLIAAWRTRLRTERAVQSGKRPKDGSSSGQKFGPHESQEAWRLLGSLELLTPEIKAELGEMLLDYLQRKGTSLWGGAAIWALGRLGARVPMYGPLNALIPVDHVERWVESMLSWNASDDAYWFAMVQMTRRTDDRYRDISDALRLRLASRMESARAPRHYVDLVRKGGELERSEQHLVFGENLPAGLRLR